VILDKLLDVNRHGSVDIPRFDKATDDRFSQPERVSGPVDIVLLEGWCLGARPQAVEDLVEPINALEKVDDPDGIWRNFVNGVLALDFLPLYQRVDRWVMLQAPSFDCVFQWRLEQEQKLARIRDARGGKRIMDDAQLARFIQFYERLTKSCLSELPRRVNHLYVLDETRRIRASQLREELPA
jgi:D-glycerate 3-kinase